MEKKEDGKEKRGCVLERYSRVTGYLSPMARWNPGKISEAKERKKFDKSLKPLDSDKKM